MKKVLDFCEKYAPELLVILVCVPFLYRLFDINSYHTFFYFTDYSTGFGGRKLLATFCDLWFPEVVRPRHVLPLIIGVHAAMVGLFAWLCGKCVRHAKENQFALLVFIAIYLLSPFSFRGFIRGEVIDCYICTATLCFLFLYMKCRGKWYYYLLTLLILCIACLTHQVFCNVFFPLVFALFIYDIFTNEQNRKKNILLYSLMTLGLFGLFCAITLAGTMNVDFETYYNYLQTRVGTNIDLSRKEALYYNMYATLPEHIQAYLIPTWKYDVARFSLTLIVFAPLWAMLLAPWIMAIKHAASKSEKWCYILIQLSLHAMILPAYIMAFDYERWTFAYGFCQICLLLIIYDAGENSITHQLNRIFKYFIQHKYLAILVIGYIVSCELVTTCTTAPMVDFLCKYLFGLQATLNELIPL